MNAIELISRIGETTTLPVEMVDEFRTALRGELLTLESDQYDNVRVKGAYGDHYEHLAAIKNKYDPTNLFHLNQNIKSAQIQP